MHVKFDGTMTYAEAIVAYEIGEYAVDAVVFISEPVAMKSGAGWYVGSWCLVAYDDKTLFPEPYDRTSGYMTEEEATSLARYWRDCDK